MLIVTNKDDWAALTTIMREYRLNANRPFVIGDVITGIRCLKRATTAGNASSGDNLIRLTRELYDVYDDLLKHRVDSYSPLHTAMFLHPDAVRLDRNKANELTTALLKDYKEILQVDGIYITLKDYLLGIVKDPGTLWDVMYVLYVASVVSGITDDSIGKDSGDNVPVITIQPPQAPN